MAQVWDPNTGRFRVYITRSNEEEVLPELPLDTGGPGGVNAGADPVYDMALEVVASQLGVPASALKGAIDKHKPQTENLDQLYDQATEQAPQPITEAVVKPPVAPILPTGPLASPAPQVDPAQELQGLLARPEPKDESDPSVLNPDQGIANNFDSAGTIAPPKGLLTGAVTDTPVIPKLDLPPPSVPISQPNLDMSQIPPEAIIQQQPKPQTPSFMDEVGNQVRQFTRGALSNATAMPMDAGAALSALAELGTQAGMFPSGPRQLAEKFMGEANRMREGAQFATGAPEKATTPGQQLALAIGKNLNPSAPITALLTGADITSQLITPAPAIAMDKATAENILFPQGRTAPTSIASVTHTIPTAGGPARVSDGDMKLLGLMGAVTLGAIFAPSVISKINQTVLPKFNLNAPRGVANAKPGTEAISNRIDLARTYDDVNAGIFRVARRAGIDPVALGNVQDTFNIQTGGAARNLINSAILNGRMETPTFSFKTKTPVADLAKKDSEAFRDYLHARDTFDDIIQKEITIQNKGKNAVAQQAALGPVEVRGMTKQDALDMVNNLERANPELKNLGLAYRENVKAMRQFMNNGQYGTLTKHEFQRLNRESSNYVPWRDQTGRKRVTDEDVDRLSPFDALKEDMQAMMRHRMENEAKGLYIDEMRKVMPNSFKRITPEEFKNNPHWEQNTVTMYRKGKLERYTTDPFIADVLNHDPYVMTGQAAQGLYASKRLMESTATGVLAPWFASTSALRSWQIGKITTGEGLKPPTLIGMTRAVPQQLYPQLAKSISESLNNGSGGWIEKVLGPQATKALSTNLADAYDRSFYAQLEHAGTHQGSFLQHNREFTAALDKVLGQTTGTAKSFIHGYKQFLNAVHNSPSFDFAVRNQGKLPLPKLAEEARHLTGDPLRTGQFTVDGKRPIRMDKPLLGSETAGKAATLATQGYGFATGIGREAVPWWNITTQGMKRVGQAYVDNPAAFVGKTYLYQAAPAAALWMYSRGAGLDPSGKSYSDYQMRGRSEYAKLMNWYIPIPGRPAEDGIEVPRFHELAPVAHMMEVALDHVARSDTFQGAEDFMRAGMSLIGAKDAFPKDNAGAMFSPSEDLGTLGKTFAEAAIVPPTPPIVNLGLATQGIVMPQGGFGIMGGEAYKKKQDPYDQLGGMNATLELMTRALGTGLADVIGSGYAAYTQTPEGVMKGVKNAMVEGSKRAIMKTPIARDVFNVKPPMSGNTDITEQLFKKEKVINNLSRYFRTWTRDNGDINPKLASERGGLVVEKLLGPNPPKQSSGLDQPAPTNPLYVAFMEEVYNKFNKDSPDKKVNPNTGAKSGGKDAVWVPDTEGGIGAKSLWRRYGDYSTQLKRLRQINEGNLVTWQMQLAQRPDQLKYLKDNNVDYQNPRSVRNFYEQKRQEVARSILFSIRAVEEDFSRRLGKPFKIEDLDPYAKGPQAGEEITPQPTIPPWSDGQNNN